MYENFNMILGENASSVSQARANDDWDHKYCAYNKNGGFYRPIL